jgi:hypothetical protein
MFIGRTVPLLKKEVVSVHSKCSSFLCPHHFSFVSSHSTPHFFSSLNFSSAAAQAQVDLKVYKNPSVLENVDITKPGTAWYFMQKHYADSKAIRHSDFLRLLKAVRPSHPSDGKLVITALRDMKRCNRFICTPEIADASVKAIMKSVSPPIDSSSSDNTKNEYDHHIHTTITDPKYQRQAACTVFNAFLDTQTGLYTSLPTKQLEICLSLLLQGIKYGENNNDEQFESKDIASMVFQTMERLIHRASNPTRHMKKRERRAYLLRRKCCEGPSPKCIDLSVNIILSLRNGDEEQDSKCLNMVNDLIHMYSTKKHLGSVMESTLDRLRVLQKQDQNE